MTAPTIADFFLNVSRKASRHRPWERTIEPGPVVVSASSTSGSIAIR